MERPSPAAEEAGNRQSGSPERAAKNTRRLQVSVREALLLMALSGIACAGFSEHSWLKTNRLFESMEEGHSERSHRQWMEDQVNLQIGKAQTALGMKREELTKEALEHGIAERTVRLRAEGKEDSDETSPTYDEIVSLKTALLSLYGTDGNR